MKLHAIALMALTVAGCGINRPVYDGSSRYTGECSSGMAPIYFIDGSNVLSNSSGRSLSNVAWVKQNCNVNKIVVEGLESRGDSELYSTRAKSLLDFLKLMGVDDVSFVDGDSDGINTPMVLWDAKPQ